MSLFNNLRNWFSLKWLAALNMAPTAAIAAEVHPDIITPAPIIQRYEYQPPATIPLTVTVNNPANPTEGSVVNWQEKTGKTIDQLDQVTWISEIFGWQSVESKLEQYPGMTEADILTVSLANKESVTLTSLLQQMEAQNKKAVVLKTTNAAGEEARYLLPGENLQTFATVNSSTCTAIGATPREVMFWNDFRENAFVDAGSYVNFGIQYCSQHLATLGRIAAISGHEYAHTIHEKFSEFVYAKNDEATNHAFEYYADSIGLIRTGAYKQFLDWASDSYAISEVLQQSTHSHSHPDPDGRAQLAIRLLANSQVPIHVGLEIMEKFQREDRELRAGQGVGLFENAIDFVEYYKQHLPSSLRVQLEEPQKADTRRGSVDQKTPTMDIENMVKQATQGIAGISPEKLRPLEVTSMPYARLMPADNFRHKA